MNFSIKALLVISIMSLSGLGLGSSVFAGDVIKPSLKGQEDRLRKAGDPKPSAEAQEVDEKEVQPRRGPHDAQQDRFGRQLGPEDAQEERYGRQGGRYDGQDGRDSRDQQYNEQGRKHDRQYGRYDKAPTRRPQGYERRLDSHFKRHYRRGQSGMYKQSYRSTSSGRSRHYNKVHSRSGTSHRRGTPSSSRYMPYQYRYR